MTTGVGVPIDELDTPAVLVDLDRLERNITRMAQLAADAGVNLRPHTKSHKTAGIAHRQLAAGAAGVTVAKLDEAEACLKEGIRDIFVANEVAGRHKWARAARLQEQGTVAVGVDSVEAARGLSEAAAERGVQIPVLVEVDTGLHRAGLPPGNRVADLAERIAPLPGVILRGVFTHAGHAYGAHALEEVQRIAHAEARGVLDSAESIRGRGLECLVISVGSTPTICAAGALPGVTEIRPGNYVFFDRMQVGLGVTTRETCSQTILATVISRPVADRIVVDAGSKTFALDRGAHGLETVAGYGEDVDHGLVLERLSEEHGIITGAAPSGIAVGSRLRFLTNHACTVANLADVLYGVRNAVVEEIFPVMVRGGGR
ncbi:MAG TPA: alanine racemase [Chloroflexota bacterium]|jgi:D-serine deaminase-like pyridoxal phosphate-dependent protein